YLPAASLHAALPVSSDKEVNGVIERRRAGFAELVPHKGPAVKGNIVHMDYTGYLNGEPFPNGSAQNQAIELGRGRMIPGLEEGRSEEHTSELKSRFD